MRHPRSRHAPLLAVVLSAALVASACGDDTSGSAATETTVADEQATTTAVDPLTLGGADSAAATLRTDLSVLLVESVLLAAQVAEGAATGDLPERPEPVPPDASEEEVAAATPASASDASARDLADVLGSVLGTEQGDEAYAALLARLAALDAYGRAGGTGPEAEAATAALADADADVADLVAEGLEATGTVTPGEAIESISGALIAVADAAVADAEAPVDLGDAPEAAAELAAELTPLLAVARELEGDVDAVGAVLRADLATALTRYSYLITTEASEPGSADPSALEVAADEVAATLEGALGAADADQLATLLTERAELFVEYGVAVTGEDEAGRAAASAALESNRDDIGSLFESRSDGALTAEAVAEALVPNERAQLAAIEAGIAGDDADARSARAAALAMDDLAFTLATVLQLELTA